MTSGLRLLLRTMSEVVLLQLGSVLRSVAHVDTWCTGRPPEFMLDILTLGSCRSEWTVVLPDAVVMSGPELQLRAMSGSIALLQPGSVLMSKVTIEDHVDA